MLAVPPLTFQEAVEERQPMIVSPVEAKLPPCMSQRLPSLRAVPLFSPMRMAVLLVMEAVPVWVTVPTPARLPMMMLPPPPLLRVPLFMSRVPVPPKRPIAIQFPVETVALEML